MPSQYLQEARSRPESHAGWDILMKAGLVAKYKLKAEAVYQILGLRNLYREMIDLGYTEEDRFLALQRLTWFGGLTLRGLLAAWTRDKEEEEEERSKEGLG